MSQITVNAAPAEAYEGMLFNSGQFPTTRISKFASELIYFGKAVAASAAADVDAGDQSVELPDSDLSASPTLMGGIAVADITLERLRNPASPADPAPFGAYTKDSSVNILRKGRIWVVSADAVDDLTKGVYVRFQNDPGTPPTATLGSFRATTNADYFLWGGANWVAAKTVNSVEFGLLEVNLP